MGSEMCIRDRIYESNRVNKVAVQTPVGLSERVDLPDIICQGGSNGPIICAVQTGSIGGEQENRGRHLYKYLGIVDIPCLTMLDDCLDISECNTDSVIDNSFIVAKMETKKLELNSEKCHKIHIGKCVENLCPRLKTHVEEMTKVDWERYLGDLLSKDGKNMININIAYSLR